jgi:uncharacterized protein (TIGR02145 family)
LQAQVSIGDLNPPAEGALLDLNRAVKGGLVLSNVAIENLATIPTSFPSINGSVSNEDKEKFTGAMVYNTNPVWGLGVYLWNGENWTPISENCKALSSLTLTAPNPPVFEGENIFSVSSGESARCAEGEEYTWQVTGNNNSNFTDFKTTVYPESSVSIHFPSSGTYQVRVKARNRYSSAIEANSNTVTVYAEPVAYYLAGKPCYDVNQSTDNRGIATTADARVALAANFNVTANRTRTYRFYHGAYSGLTISLEGSNTNIVTNYSQPPTSKSVNGVETFTVVFSGDEGTALLKASYTDKEGNPQQTNMEITVQDALCGCPARITPQGAGASNTAADWLVFQCHNLGGKDILSSAQSLTYEEHGDWYRWGAKDASVKNEGNNNSAITGWTSEGNTGDSSPYTPYYQSNAEYGTANWFECNNPCPAGWRVPTIPEWGLVINRDENNGNLGIDKNNTVAWPGNWSGSFTGFSSRLKVGDYLYLPATGSRRATNGELYNRDLYGRYWSSSSGIRNGMYFFYTSQEGGSRNLQGYDRGQGFSVRCVAVAF